MDLSSFPIFQRSIEVKNNTDPFEKIEKYKAIPNSNNEL
jgi:hypothetical protein